MEGEKRVGVLVLLACSNWLLVALPAIAIGVIPGCGGVYGVSKLHLLIIPFHSTYNANVSELIL